MTAGRAERFLRGRGCPDDVVRAGAEGLVAAWERAADDIARGYPLGLDDYLNDVDGRQLLDDLAREVAEAVGPHLRERVAAADARVRSGVVPSPECLWGEAVARREDWTPQRNWWYFSLPREPGPQLAEELGL